MKVSLQLLYKIKIKNYVKMNIGKLVIICSRFGDSIGVKKLSCKATYKS